MKLKDATLDDLPAGLTQDEVHVVAQLFAAAKGERRDGLSIVVFCGRWARPSVFTNRDAGIYRLCLGWVAVQIITRDFDPWIEDLCRQVAAFTASRKEE
jgi:hypothetical protein